jgi:hypothetical protein
MEGNTANNNANSNQNNAQNTTGQQTNQNANQNQQSNNVVDYAKIQEMIDGRNAKTEDSILKSYFQKQGLSAEEMESAINTFKAQRESQATQQNKELSDTQNSLKTEQLKNQKLQISLKAYSFVDELNIDNKTMPYLLKMVDFSNCVDKEGKVNDETLKQALQKVIDDVPGLKKQVQNSVGIVVGANTNNNQSSNSSAFDFGFSGVRPIKNK